MHWPGAGAAWEWELYSAKYRELIKKEVSLNSIWIGPYCCCISRAQRQQRKSAARPRFSFRASPGFISAAIIENCESRGQRSAGADSYNVPTSALHNVTTQNLSKILTHLVVDGTQKVYDKYINKGRKNLRMSFSHSFLPPPVQCDVESVAALIQADVILWIMYMAVWWLWCGKGQHINTDASYSQSSSTKLLPPPRDQNNIPTLTHFYLHHPPNILMSQSFVRIAFYFYI